MADENRPAGPLWGEPFPERQETRGRKRHKRSPEVAELVAALKAAGLSVVDIALRVNLSEPTLRKYYFRELEHGAALIRSVVIEGQLRKAKEGVVGAARFLREEFERGDARSAQRAIEKRSVAAAPAKEPKLGKKEERQAAAGRVKGIFAPPAPPKQAH